MPKDRRNPDQNAAMEKAFVAATLPEDDRRDAPVVIAEPAPLPSASLYRDNSKPTPDLLQHA